MKNKKINLTIDNLDELTYIGLEPDSEVDTKTKEEQRWNIAPFEISDSLTEELFGDGFESWLIIRTPVGVSFTFDSAVYIERKAIEKDSIFIVDCDISMELRCDLYGIILDKEL